MPTKCLHPDCRKAKPKPEECPGHKCLHPDCLRTDLKSRGLCAAHYRQVTRLLSSGSATEADLMARGLMLPPRSGTRAGRTAAAAREVFKLGSMVRGRARARARKTKTSKKKTRKKSRR